MEWVRALVEVIHDEIHPYSFGPGGERELVRVPASSGKTSQWCGWIALGFPGGLVEVAFGDVVVAGHLLDFGVDDVGLLGLGG